MRLLILFGLLLSVIVASATPSGLNNIPTADTAGHRSVAVQVFDTFGSGPHDLGFVRLSAGYGLQNDGNSLLLGLDRTWKMFGRSLNLNADLVQIRDGDGWLSSVGAKFDLTEQVILET